MGSQIREALVYLATADGEGNMVSFIQSNYMGFGSGLVVPERESLYITEDIISQWIQVM